MNLFDMNSDKTIMNIDGQDMEMRHPICFGKEYDKILVSKCGKVWSYRWNKVITGNLVSRYNKDTTAPKCVVYALTLNEEDWWGDGSSRLAIERGGTYWSRKIAAHKMIIDTWAPLYDNPPEGIEWKEWKVVRDLPNTYDFISKTVVIDHIDDDPTNNHVDNLRRVTQWDNQPIRKAKGI